ncbi:Uu.00g055630.m01.CDS01 [Anthostomella pinea]|uniref:Uu.00g055630.m01.CDS01 n=1 Tax=Anthostomella pinea TaxID=933095 RepID=A0AAI8VWW9_9PEZI|nr:Uu.00g055630.m01.CDS01 [Anthostomella pinea]
MPLQIPHPTAPLHLYRQLLREASYLPPLCRPWIASRIQTRFRDCRSKEDPKPYVQQAHHSLRYLRSANGGHLERLLHLCYLATGRVGKRRRRLSAAYLSQRPANDTAGLEDEVKSLQDDNTLSADRAPDWLDNWAVDKIFAIASSQVERQSKDWPHLMRRQLRPKDVIPTENSFGRPLHKGLARNKLKRHWASVLRQLLPPLPSGEWERLRALTRGEAGADELRSPVRRPVAQSTSDLTNPIQWDWAKYVTRPARANERGNSRKMKSLTAEEGEDPRGPARPIGVRVLGPRKLKRGLYGRVWDASPIIERNSRNGKWLVTWGNNDPKLSPPSTRDLVFFQDVGKAGRGLQPATRKRGR